MNIGKAIEEITVEPVPESLPLPLQTPPPAAPERTVPVETPEEVPA